jgi:Ca2+-binding EF-hand superfamily protein
MRLFTKFIQEHRPDLETAFLQQDKDHSGKLSSEDLKTSLKLAGLRLTLEIQSNLY